MAEEYLNKSTVTQLKEQCTQRKLETTGKKSELVQRLIDFLDENPDDELAKTINGTEEAMEEEEEANGEAEVEGDDDGGAGDAEEEEEVKKEAGDEAENDEESPKKKEETKDEKEEKKEEKKTPAKQKVRPPGPRDFKRDSNIDMRRRSVVVGPITPDDLKRDEIQEYAKKASCFFVRIHHDVEGEKHIGHVEYRFNSWEEAETAAEEFPKLSEECIVKRLAERLSAENVDREIRKTENAEREELDLRTISAYNIPVATSEEQLKSVFTEVKSMLIARDDEGIFKGFVYLEYDTIEKTKEAYEKFKEGETKFEDQKVSFNRIATVPRMKKGPFMKDDEPLPDERREYLVTKRAELRNKIKGQIPMGKKRNFETQIFKIERRLEADNDVRKKKDLPPKGPKLKQGNSTPSGKRSSSMQQSHEGRSPRGGGPRGRGSFRGRGGGGGGGREGGRDGGFRGASRSGSRVGNQYSNRGRGGFRNQQLSPSRGRGNRFGRGGMGGGSGGGSGMGGGIGASPQNQGGPQGRLNPQATANAVNLLVGLSNMLNGPGQMGNRQEGGDFNRGGGNTGWDDGNYSRGNQSGGANWNQGGSGSGGSGGNYGSDRNFGSGGGNWENRGGYDDNMGGGNRNYNDNYYDDPAAKRSRMSDYGSGSGSGTGMGNSNWNSGSSGYGSSSNNMGGGGGGSFSGGSGFGNSSDNFSRYGTGTGTSNFSSFSSGMGGSGNTSFGTSSYGGSSFGNKSSNYSSGGNSGFRGGNNRKRSRSKSGGYF